MIKIEYVEVWGFEHAIRGMRNPMNSWGKSDSKWVFEMLDVNEDLSPADYVVGPNDLSLMRKLFAAGTEHRKYMRQIMVSMDVTAPLYLWKEMDTYKVGTVCNSCSTMHEIHAKEFEDEDFSMEHLIEDRDHAAAFISSLHRTIADLNTARELFLETKDKVYWWQMIQLLPSSYNQRRTLTMNYEVAATIIRQREGHKLDEWNQFVKVLKGLPYMAEIMGGEKE